MKNFFKTVVASMLGFVIGSFLLLFIVGGIIAGLASSGSKEGKPPKDNSVLRIKFNKKIVEREVDNPFSKIPMPFGSAEGEIPLDKLLLSLRHAAKDPQIKGIYLEFEALGGGMASIEAIRKELIAFKKSGKFVYSYAEVMTEKGYYLASAGDSIFLHPTGYLEWNGLNSNPMFLKGAFEKLGVEPMLFRVGQFKSAGEMFTEKQMSAANRKQTEVLLNDLWNYMLNNIAESRKLNRDSIDKLAATLAISHASDAVKHKIIDKICYRDQVESSIKAKTKTNPKEKINWAKLGEYMDYASAEKAKGNEDNKVAVIYAVGDIESGEGDENTIGSDGLCKAIREAREDVNVKAVVLRVNSPGGSALASDVIWREIMLTKKLKPVLASYGDVAASGGYYISAACDKIYAEPTTITGSIGVFGLLFNTQKLFNEKIGITFDRAYSNQNQYADMGDPNRPMSEFERKKTQDGVNKIYGEFIGVVQKGRSFPDSVAVDSIAQGRVWSGVRAKEIKLVDELGGLQDAIAAAAQKAGLGDNYSIEHFPKHKSKIEKILEDFSTKMETRTLEKYLSKEQIELAQKIKTFNAPRGLYMRLTDDYDFN